MREPYLGLHLFLWRVRPSFEQSAPSRQRGEFTGQDLIILILILREREGNLDTHTLQMQVLETTVPVTVESKDGKVSKFFRAWAYMCKFPAMFGLPAHTGRQVYMCIPKDHPWALRIGSDHGRWDCFSAPGIHGGVTYRETESLTPGEDRERPTSFIPEKDREDIDPLQVFYFGWDYNHWCRPGDRELGRSHGKIISMKDQLADARKCLEAAQSDHRKSRSFPHAQSNKGIFR